MSHKSGVMPIEKPERKEKAPRRPLKAVSEKRAQSGEPIGLKRTELSRVSERKREEKPQAISTLTRSTPLGHCTDEQKARVAEAACAVCRGHAGFCTPAHVVPRGHPKMSDEAADDPRAVVPLCLSCHREFDEGAIDLTAYLEPAYRDSQEWAAGAVGLASALRSITGQRDAATPSPQPEGVLP